MSLHDEFVADSKKFWSGYFGVARLRKKDRRFEDKKRINRILKRKVVMRDPKWPLSARAYIQNMQKEYNNKIERSDKREQKALEHYLYMYKKYKEYEQKWEDERRQRKAAEYALRKAVHGYLPEGWFITGIDWETGRNEGRIDIRQVVIGEKKR